MPSCKGGQHGDTCENLRCASTWLETVECKISTPATIRCLDIKAVYNSWRKCFQSGYGYSKDTVWVTNGCDAKFKACYDTVDTTTTTEATTTAIVKTTQQTTHFVTTNGVITNSSVEVAGQDGGSDSGGVIVGVVGGVIAAIVIIALMLILLILIRRRRLKSRYNHQEDKEKTPPTPTYDYAYQEPLSDDESRHGSSTVINEDNNKYVGDQQNAGNSTSNQLSDSLIDNAVYGRGRTVDSHGYLILKAENGKEIEENEYHYAYDQSPNIQRRGSDNYVNSRVSAQIVDSNQEYCLANDPIEDNENDYATDLNQDYEIPEQLVHAGVANPKTSPGFVYSLAAEPAVSNVEQLSPKYSLATDSNVGNAGIPQEYNLAKNPQTTKKPPLIPKQAQKQIERSNVDSTATTDVNIYQNTKVKQLIAHMNNFNVDKEGFKKPEVMKKTQNGHKSNETINDSKQSIPVNKNLKSNLLTVGIPQLNTSRSENDLNKHMQGKNKNKKALMPPKVKIRKSVSSDELYENYSVC